MQYRLTPLPWLWLVFSCALFATTGWFALAQPAPHLSTIQIGGQPLQVELAQTTTEQRTGLAGRASLSDDMGMLFVYTQPEQPIVWMRGMRLPIDIIWIRDGQVIAIDTDIQPDNGTLTYTPPRLVTSFVEVAAGWSEEHAIQPGDSVELSSKF